MPTFVIAVLRRGFALLVIAVLTLALGVAAGGPTAATAAEPLLALRWSAPFSISSHEEHPESLACPSSSFCLATDLSGNVITSSNPSGGPGTWTKAHISGSTPDLLSVSCPSVSFCAVAGVAFNPPEFKPHSEIWTSSNPTGGASAWHATGLGEAYVQSISCPTASFCAAIGKIEVEGEEHPRSKVWTSTDPGGGSSAWQSAELDPGNELTAVGCPVSTLCLAVDEEGNVLTSTNPAGGSAAWSAPQSIGPQTNGIPVSLNAVSCVGVTFCAVSTGYDYLDTDQPGTGNLVYSFNPTGGASAWGVSPPMADGLFSLACPGVGECLSTDYSGNVYSAASASAEATGFAWTVQNLEPVNYFRVFVGAACPSTEHCFLLDSEGNVFVGHPYEGEAEVEAPPGEEHGGGNTGGGTGGGGGNAPGPPQTTPGDSGPKPLSLPSATISSTQLVALLRTQLTPHGQAAKIRSLLKHGGLVMPFTAPAAGTLSVQWWQAPSGARLAKRAKPVLVALGRQTFTATTAGHVVVKLTSVGKGLLRRAHRLSLTVQATFGPVGAAPATVTLPLVLRG